MTKPSNDDNFTTNELFASNSSIDLSFFPHIFFSLFFFFLPRVSIVVRIRRLGRGGGEGKRKGSVSREERSGILGRRGINRSENRAGKG